VRPGLDAGAEPGRVTPVTLRRPTYAQGFDIRPGGRHHRRMATDVPRPRAHRSSLGYVTVLLGAALFVASCFLPYVGYAGLSIPGTKTTTSLYQQLTLGPNGGSSDLSSVLYLFGGIAPVAVVAVVALVRGERRPVLPPLLVGAVVAWSLTWIGALLRLGTFYGVSLEIGFWLQAVSIGVAVIGTMLVGFGKLSEVKDSHDRYANEEGADADA
jgi:hypothetical protein